ncbi:5-formyltetrahydrofolate cyclo-ligase, mitochondrial isoform X2 [Ricinus communis]|uniref:5-formyltetrahydrofolate cyclo-ligase, mitochondrial isoform X2 n=1 Tax=Ricinus communis TaxID=3988 RepID=UPI00201AED65|nr:5-formyltetrahydrofolate cyclo-ligase, mitochondrial isoform X2 [Ricinus communis]
MWTSVLKQRVKAAFMIWPLTFSPTTLPPSLLRPTATMSIAQHQTANFDEIFKQKRILRSKVRKSLKSMDPSLRSEEDGCAQTPKKLYVPRVEDKNSHMRMLNISSMDDLIANSMNILEPAPIDGLGNKREDVLQANDPVDLFLLPGLAFERTGKRLGRGGGYYDTFLRKYQELARERNWKQPLFVGLSYSLQIMDEGVIPVTSHDVLVDALVTPSGMIPISPSAV